MLNAEPETLDLDTYKILRSYLKKHSHQIKSLGIKMPSFTT